MTGFRIGYACGPAELIEAMMKIHQYSMLCASIISQEAAIEAIEHGEPDTLRDARPVPAAAQFHRAAPSTTWACPATCRAARSMPSPASQSTGLSSKEFAVHLLEEEKVACVPGSAFGPSGEGFLRCCFATSLDQIKVATERIARFLGRLQK